jgi:hypothetical protein
MAQKIYRVTAPESGTFYQPEACLWFCGGVAYVGEHSGMEQLHGFRYDEVGSNHDEITDTVPAWYRAAFETLSRLAEQGQAIEDPRADENGAVRRVLAPNIVTYCDSPEPHAPGSAWFVEGIAYLPADHPRAAYYSGHAEYTVERVDREPAWWPAAFAALRSMPAARLGPPAADGAGPAFARR